MRGNEDHEDNISDHREPSTASNDRTSSTKQSKTKSSVKGKDRSLSTGATSDDQKRARAQSDVQGSEKRASRKPPSLAIETKQHSTNQESEIAYEEQHVDINPQQAYMNSGYEVDAQYADAGMPYDYAHPDMHYMGDQMVPPDPSLLPLPPPQGEMYGGPNYHPYEAYGQPYPEADYSGYAPDELGYLPQGGEPEEEGTRDLGLHTDYGLATQEGYYPDPYMTDDGMGPSMSHYGPHPMEAGMYGFPGQSLESPKFYPHTPLESYDPGMMHMPYTDQPPWEQSGHPSEMYMQGSQPVGDSANTVLQPEYNNDKVPTKKKDIEDSSDRPSKHRKSKSTARKAKSPSTSQSAPATPKAEKHSPSTRTSYSKHKAHSPTSLRSNSDDGIVVMPEIKNRVAIRKLSDGRELKFCDMQDLRAFDEIHKWRVRYPRAPLEHAMALFCSKFQSADVLVPIAFGVNIWDYIIRYQRPKFEDGTSLARAEFEKHLCMKGVILDIEPSKEKPSIVFVKVIVPFHILCREAKVLKLMFPLKEPISPLTEDALPKRKQGFLGVHKYHLDLNRHFALLDPLHLERYQFKSLGKGDDYIYSDCAGQPLHKIMTKFFEERQRLLIAYSLIMDTEIKLKTHHRFRHEGIHHLIEHKIYLDFYPTHQKDEAIEGDPANPPSPSKSAKSPTKAKNTLPCLRTRLLKEYVKSNLFGAHPVDFMKDYFGEKVALYFVYLRFYNQWLLGSSILGLLVCIYGIFALIFIGDASIASWHRLFDNGITPFFGLSMAIWSALYLRFWERQTSYYAVKWAVDGFEESTMRRHEFECEGKRKSPVTGKIELHFSNKKRYFRQFLSIVATLPFIGLVICTVLAQITFIAWLQATYNANEQGSSLIASVLGLVSIQICRRLYRPVAEKLNDFENYRTTVAYERSLVAKNFMFEFINIYSHIIYFAFVRQFLTAQAILGFPLKTNTCEKDVCSADVTLELFIIFLGDQAVDRMEELLIPWIVQKIRSTKAAFHQVTPEKKRLPPYYKDEKRVPNEGLDDDYFQKAIQYGYVTMFVTAFPLAPLFALINNLFEVRLDSFKMLRVLRRPPPFQAANIGIWEDILRICSVLAVSTNGMLVAFSSEYLFSVWIEPHPSQDWMAIRLGFLLVWHCLVYFISYVIMWAVPKEPYIVRIAQARKKYLERIIVDPNQIAEDEVDNEEVATSYVDLTRGTSPK